MKTIEWECVNNDGSVTCDITSYIPVVLYIKLEDNAGNEEEYVVNVNDWVCESGISITVPDGLRYLSSDSFKKCEYVLVISLPKTIRGISIDTFDSLSKLCS
eukprot:gnl/Chilomastix_caulleri/4511.p1 GENE.gnl/Chilomastix_caulleri/4511~~gnl/Chilomastix_caulleri/4511.p1  ORF type:complete len:102 (-),score=25.00 gnl/Chilomastix_caulleri/4511:70-375(-)